MIDALRAPGTREALGTIWNHLDRPSGSWNARSAICIVRWQDGIAPYIISVLLSPGTPSGLLERPPALERPPGYWNACSANGTIWNFGTALGLLEQSRRLYLERAKR